MNCVCQDFGDNRIAACGAHCNWLKAEIGRSKAPYCWTQDCPTEHGWYVYKACAEWCLRLYKVEKGDWRLSRNPEWLYANDKAVQQFDIGYWLRIEENYQG